MLPCETRHIQDAFCTGRCLPCSQVLASQSLGHGSFQCRYRSLALSPSVCVGCRKRHTYFRYSAAVSGFRSPQTVTRRCGIRREVHRLPLLETGLALRLCGVPGALGHQQTANRAATLPPPTNICRQTVYSTQGRSLGGITWHLSSPGWYAIHGAGGRENPQQVISSNFAVHNLPDPWVQRRLQLDSPDTRRPALSYFLFYPIPSHIYPTHRGSSNLPSLGPAAPGSQQIVAPNPLLLRSSSGFRDLILSGHVAKNLALPRRSPFSAAEQQLPPPDSPPRVARRQVREHLDVSLANQQSSPPASRARLSRTRLQEHSAFSAAKRRLVAPESPARAVKERLRGC